METLHIGRAEIIDTALKCLDEETKNSFAVVVVNDLVFPQLLNRLKIAHSMLSVILRDGYFEKEFKKCRAKFYTESAFKKEKGVKAINFDNLNTLNREQFDRHFKTTPYKPEQEFRISVSSERGLKLGKALIERQRLEIAASIIPSLMPDIDDTEVDIKNMVEYSLKVADALILASKQNEHI